MPPGWQKYETPGGHPAYDFTVVEDAGRRALSMKSAGEHSTIAKEVQADLAATPILAWQWRVQSLPERADLRNRATSDATGHIFAVWPRFPAFVRSRLIGYVWDPALPIGTVLPSRKTAAVTFIVVRRGDAGLGRWQDDRRNVADDYRTVFGEAPPPCCRRWPSPSTRTTRGHRPRPCSAASSCKRAERRRVIAPRRPPARSGC